MASAWIFVLSVFVLPCLICDTDLLMQISPEKKGLAACTLAMLRKYFDSGENLSGSVISMSLTWINVDLQEYLLQHLHNHFHSYPWSIVLTNAGIETKKLEFEMNEKPQCYFLVLENLDDIEFEDIFIHWKSFGNWNPFAQFVVYIVESEETDEYMTDLMIELLLLFVSKKLFKVNVIGQSLESNYYFGKTVFPYDPDNNCGNRVISLGLLDSCEYDDGLDNVEPQVILVEFIQAKFSDRFPQNLGGCPLRTAYRTLEPYIFTESENESEEEAEVNYYDTGTDIEDNSTDYYADKSSSTIDEKKPKLKGIEFELMKTIAKCLHMSMDIEIENSNLYKLFQLLFDGEIDVIIGGIDVDSKMSDLVSSSIPYHQDDLTWCVAKSKSQHSLFNFLTAFSVNFWLLIILFIAITSFIILVAQRLKNQHPYLKNYFSIFIQLSGILLSQSIDDNKFPLVLRTIFIWCFILGFYFGNTFQGILISIFSNPLKSHQISQLHEIYANQMRVTGRIEAVRHLNKEGEIFKYIREKFEMCYDLEDCLIQARDDEHLAVIASRHNAFYNPRIPRDDLYCFDRDENIYVYPVTMLLPKNDHLLYLINPTIQNIIESGHMQKWARDLDMIRTIHDEIHRQREDAFKPLKLEQVLGAIVFTCGLLLVAIGVFILESLVHYCVTKQRTRLIPLRYIHRRLGQQ